MADMKSLWSKAVSAFESGISVFENADDVANQALLYCNYGGLMRLIAQTYTNVTRNGNRHEFTVVEREYYNKVSMLKR